ncbi:hypothetical protein [Hymenobacter coalescens]
MRQSLLLLLALLGAAASAHAQLGAALEMEQRDPRTGESAGEGGSADRSTIVALAGHAAPLP